MKNTIRKFTNNEDMRVETYRYWHGRSSSEISQVTWEMSRKTYRDYY